VGMTAAEYRETVPERDLEEILRELCDLLGIVRIHQRDSVGTMPGAPDDKFIGGRVMYREIKTATGRITPAQKAFLALLRAAGEDADVWRPADFASGRVARELQAIAPPPGHPARAAAAQYRAAAEAQRRARRKGARTSVR
jgi:hypothetical protein